MKNNLIVVWNWPTVTDLLIIKKEKNTIYNCGIVGNKHQLGIERFPVQQLH